MSLTQKSPACTISSTHINSQQSISTMKDDVPTLSVFALESKVHSTSTSATSNYNEQSTIDEHAREWFQSLSSEERSGATRFSDRAFFGAFLSLATPWSMSTKAFTTAINDEGNHGSGAIRSGGTSRPALPVSDQNSEEEDFIPWDTLVSLSEFNKIYHELEMSLDDDTPKLANRKSSSQADVVDTTLGHVPRSDSNNEINSKIDDEFRIQRLRKYEVSYLRSMNNEKQPKRGTKSNTTTSIRHLLDDVAIIFPSVFQNITGTIVPNPHLLIRPSYFDYSNHNGQQIVIFSSNYTSTVFDGRVRLVPFDESMTQYNKDSLLWSRRLLNAENGDFLVPLSYILVARLEWAAWESFLEFEYFKKIRPIYLTTTNAAAIDVKINTNEDMNYPRNHLLSVLGDILSHCRAINDRSLTIDSSTLEAFVAPLVSLCFSRDACGDDENFDDVQNIILTPILWVWFSFQRNSSTDFGILDKAIAASLEKMDNNREISGKVTDSDSNNVAVGFDNPTASGSHEQSPRKKKKKNKKKKGKKSANSENQNATITIEIEQSNVVNRNEASAEKHINTKLEGGICSDQMDSCEDAINVTFPTDSVETQSVDSDDTPFLDLLLLTPSTKANIERSDDVSCAKSDRKLLVAAPLTTKTNQAPNSNSTEGTSNETTTDKNDEDSAEGDIWETVEVRGRSSRKKAPSTPPAPPELLTNNKQSASSTSYTNEQQKLSSKKSKAKNTNGSQRKKSFAHKIVSDILCTIIDSIEDESKKMKHTRITTATRPVNSWKNGPPGVAQKIITASIKDVSGDDICIIKREKVGLDVMPGNHTGTDNAAKASTILANTDGVKTPSVSPIKSNEFKSVTKTDQNTAPTYQDTSSSSSNAILGSKGEPQHTVDRKSDTSSSDTEEIPDNVVRELASKLDALDSTTPPLPTLLSPANANSATSSVASSLEAPPRGRIHHHSDTVKDVNDVGYHLLDVCDRLSRDMSLFMSRRALALNVRRRERRVILSALQNSVASIWPGRCHVELYGSCATELDLPSSDIDVVVLGLYRNSYIAPQHPTDVQLCSSGTVLEESYVNDEVQRPTMQPLMPPAAYGMIQHQRNSEQVVKLAADLEKQPWAVQVNAIPTASVPVIKVLADPSKLGSAWITQQQQFVGHEVNDVKESDAFNNLPNPEYSKADSGSYPPPTHVPWRGSDVMKGLLSLDITFEGPEHGGIGSTEFSSQTVAEACNETGLEPDATPFVQTLMVLKELLAQRKLNEPYSGGLSSYALLLLVLALVRERAVIREEIELVEQQRRAMSGGELDSFPNGTIPFESVVPLEDSRFNDSSQSKIASETTNTQKNLDSGKEPLINNKLNDGKTVRPSSWAMIAKMSPSFKSPALLTDKKNITTSEIVKQPAEKSTNVANSTTEVSTSTKPTFADAVSGSNKLNTAIDKKESKIKSKDIDKSSDNATSTAKPYLTKAIHPEHTPSVCHSAPQFTSNSESIASQIGGKSRTPAFYPQGYNDIVEVLCSGETTAGKLLMHFLLYYGQHFDAQSTAIDISGKHERNYDGQIPPMSYLSPYIQRQPMGNIDPRTGMLTVDCLIVYDPLEGSENNNVSRRCFAWNSVRWIFAQSYATLASFVERSATPPTSPNGGSVPQAIATSRDQDIGTIMFSPDSNGDLMDPSSPLLRCLLSF